MLKISQGKMPFENLYVKDFSDGLDGALSANKYDAIIATYSMHHLEDEDKIKFIKSLMPLLNDGERF